VLTAGNRQCVLMPCRALEAFRPPAGEGPLSVRLLCLNALSGIGGVQTYNHPGPGPDAPVGSLNALSGIGGVQTIPWSGLAAMLI